jgi:hypothetical protein
LVKMWCIYEAFCFEKLCSMNNGCVAIFSLGSKLLQE